MLAQPVAPLAKSWSKAKAACPRPEHAGSRVRFDGHYGPSGHRRQYYKCIPANGDRPHRFAEVLPREESWHDACELCERDVGFHEGPHAARRYQFVARGVAARRCRHLQWPRGRRLKWPHLASVVVGLDVA